MRIESTQNPQIKNLVRLQQKSKARKDQSLFLVEGLQEVQFALANRYKAVRLLVCEEIFQNAFEVVGFEVVSISRAVFEKLAYRTSTGGILGLFEAKTHAIAAFIPKEKGIYLVLEGIEKPGNLGAILRSADGAGVDGVFITGSGVDLYNPNTIRSSVGTLFSTPIFLGTCEAIYASLVAHKVRLVATYLGENTQNLYQAKWTGSVAFILGTEATGLEDFWLNKEIQAIKIPMLGTVDSLNVSTAAALCMYEARRRWT